MQKYDSSADPRVFSQCLKNALLPPMPAVNVSALQSLQHTLEKTPGLSQECCKIIIACIMMFVQLFYEANLADTLRIYRQAYISAQIMKLPPHIVFGPFDKGATVLWAACQNLFLQYIFNPFFRSPIPYKELLWCDTVYSAGLEIWSWLTGSLSRHYFPRNRQHPTPRSVILRGVMDDFLQSQGRACSSDGNISEGFLRLIKQAMQSAEGRYHAFVCKHEHTASIKQQTSDITTTLVQGLKHKRQDTATVEFLSCASNMLVGTRKRYVPLPFHLMTCVALFAPKSQVLTLACVSKQFLSQIRGIMHSMSTAVQPWATLSAAAAAAAAVVGC